MSILRCTKCDAAVDTDFYSEGHTDDAGDYICAECVADGLDADADYDHQDAEARGEENEDERLDCPRHGQADRKRP